MAVKETKPLDPYVVLLLLLTLGLLLVRLYAARVVGWGDSEALYATYALHPQPAYLDHPGLVGIFASSLGGGRIPSAAAAHVATAALATAFPWLVVVVARSTGAPARPAAIAGLVVAATPELGVGLFAMTPDLLLSFLWLAFLGLGAAALEAPKGTARAAGLFVAAGLFAGAASTAKVTGLLLFPALAATVWTDGTHRKTPWPWLGALVGLVPLVPIARFEAARGYPMLRHRLIDTQHAAGLSLRNAGALVGGQLVYLSPVLAVLAALVAWQLVKHRSEDGVTRLLFWSFAVPLVPLVALCLWSRVAEPHWVAPPLLALPVFAARRGLAYSRKLVAAGVATGLAFVAAVYAWVLSPSLVRFAPARYDAKVDISNELFGWRDATRAAGELRRDASADTGELPWLVGPSWMICAQLQANAPDARVGCVTPVPSDFDDWAPRSRFLSSNALIYVTESRPFARDEPPLPEALRAFHVARTERVSIVRGGRVVRAFRLALLERLGAARRELGPPNAKVSRAEAASARGPRPG